MMRISPFFRLLVFLVSALVFLLVGFLSLGKEESVVNEPSVSLKAEAEIHEDGLFLQYKATNATDESIYLINRVFQWTFDGLIIQPELVYTELIENHLRLTKACIEIPDNVDVGFPSAPFLSQVNRGSELEESFTLSLPIVPFHPYSVVRKDEESYIFNHLELAIGWVSEKEVSIQQIEDHNGNSQFFGDFHELVKAQHLLIKKFNLEVPAFIKPQ